MLKDVLNLETIRIGNVIYTDADLEALSLDKLREMKLKVNSLVLEISTQIKSRQAEFSGGGEPAKKEWYINAKHALSLWQRFMPYLSAMIRRRELEGRTVESYFMDVARDMIHPEDFNEILAEAKRRKKANSPE